MDDPRIDRRKDELVQIRNVLHDIAITLDNVEKMQKAGETAQHEFHRILRGDETDIAKPGVLARLRDAERQLSLIEKIVYGTAGAVMLELVHIILQILEKK